MSSLQRIEANRRNGRLSRGPRTPAGKAAAARNSRRHGLRVPVLADPEWAGQVRELACLLAGPGAGAERLARAARIAEAQVDLVRIRTVKQRLLERHGVLAMIGRFERPNVVSPLLGPLLAQQFSAIARYEKRAIGRRSEAVRAFDRLCGAEGR